MLLVGKVYPGKGQGKARGGGVPNATKPGQLKKSEREALGRLQMVRVQPELALGSLADWLQAPWPMRRAGVSQEKAQGTRWGPPGAPPTLTLHQGCMAGRTPSQRGHTCHELPAFHLSTPSPSSSPESWSTPSQA